MTGEQSPTPEKVTHAAEIDALRAEVARLKAEHADEIAWMKRGALNCVLDEREACVRVVNSAFLSPVVKVMLIVAIRARGQS